MVRMEIEELDNQAATVQKQVEIMEERRLQLEKSYEKAINLQSDIHQSIGILYSFSESGSLNQCQTKSK